MAVSQDVVEKIQDFVFKRQKIENNYNSQPLNATALQSYSHAVDETLRKLQEQVRSQEDELEKLRASNSIDLSYINTDTWAHVSQVQRAKAAYDSLHQSDTELPERGSPLPSLLAVRETSKLIKETKSSVNITARKLSADRQRLKTEEANLVEGRLIQGALEERILAVLHEKSKGETKPPTQLAQEFIHQQRAKNKELEKATSDLERSLRIFIDETLALKLAAEDTGGPTVGNALNISDVTLEAGYTSHGKPKKKNFSSAQKENRNQQHINEIFRLQQPGQAGDAQRPPANKREAAASEMHALLDALLNAGSSYIDVPRESAATRFLVRAKVAQFHPRDARRLRLIDFGRLLE